MATIPTLALIPSGVKATKVYSVLPTDGSGDFDFTRSGSATRVNSEGLIELVSTNVPRLNYPLIDGVVQGCPSLLLEPSATAINNFSEELDNAYWIGSAVVTANTDISPNGSQNADTLNDNTTGFLDKRGVITVTPNVAHTFSFFVKKTYGELTHYAGMAALLTGVATRVDYGIINTTTGVINRDASSNINSVSYSSVSYGDYWRVIMTFTDNQSNTTCTIITYPAISINGTSLNQNAQGSNVFWGINFTQSTYATSYIPTTTGAATRSAETCNNAGDVNTFNGSEGVLFVEMSALANDLTSRRINLRNSSGSNQVRIQYGTDFSNQIVAVLFNGVNQAVISNTSYDILNFNKIAFKYKENDFALWINGIEVGTDISGTTIGAGILDRIDLSLSTVETYSNIKQIQYFDTALTDLQLQQLTTL